MRKLVEVARWLTEMAAYEELGVTLFEGVEDAEVPTAFVAVTVKV